MNIKIFIFFIIFLLILNYFKIQYFSSQNNFSYNKENFTSLQYKNNNFINILNKYLFELSFKELQHKTGNYDKNMSKIKFK